MRDHLKDSLRAEQLRRRVDQLTKRVITTAKQLEKARRSQRRLLRAVTEEANVQTLRAGLAQHAAPPGPVSQSEKKLRARPSVFRSGPRDFPCESCGAAAGEPCTEHHGDAAGGEARVEIRGFHGPRKRMSGRNL